MKLLLVRHGETEENRLGIMQGHLPGKLSRRGKLQAKQLALRLKDEQIDYIYSSDLDRCIKTTKEIAKFHPNAKLRISNQLREQSKGKLEGKPRIELQKIQEKSKKEWWMFKPKNGESAQEVWNRVVNFYQKIKRKHQKETILVISHGGPISCLLTYLHKKPIQMQKVFKPANTAVSIIQIDEKDKCTFKSVNCIKHISV